MKIFDSNDGFQTKVWGPPAWLFLHLITLNYNPERKHQHLLFFKSLGSTLPCGKCRENYNYIINNILPINVNVLKNRFTLSFWLFKVHNKVQEDIYKKTKDEPDKPIYKNTKMDYMKAMIKYEKIRASCKKESYGCTESLNGKKLMLNMKIKIFKKRKTGNSLIM